MKQCIREKYVNKYLTMKKMAKVLIFVFLITNLYECDKTAMDNKYAVYVLNNANHSIGCYFALGGNYGTLYPDTSLPASNQYIISDIKSGSKYIYDSGIEWKDIYSKFPKDTMSVFIFHSDTLRAVNWAEIRCNYKILKRYDLSLDDLKRMNWTITYP